MKLAIGLKKKYKAYWCGFGRTEKAVEEIRLNVLITTNKNGLWFAIILVTIVLITLQEVKNASAKQLHGSLKEQLDNHIVDLKNGGRIKFKLHKFLFDWLTGHKI